MVTTALYVWPQPFGDQTTIRQPKNTPIINLKHIYKQESQKA